MIKKIQQYCFLPLLILMVYPLSAQEIVKASDTIFFFRFVPKKDMFFVPYKGNEIEIKRLRGVLAENFAHLQAGDMYISVSGYAPSSDGKISPKRMGYLRNSRVKSEMIARSKVTEKMFVTDHVFSNAYHDSLRNVVVVMVPAPLETVRRIAGEEAAKRVEVFLARNSGSKTDTEQDRIVEEAALHKEKERKAQAQKAKADSIAKEKAESGRWHPAADVVVKQPDPTVDPDRDYYESDSEDIANFFLHANLVRWVTITPDLGVEWRSDTNWGILLNGSWTSLSWSSIEKRYALWNISPSFRYYWGENQFGYVGAMLHAGQFNYKPAYMGRQGAMYGGGIVGGYQVPVANRLLLDFTLTLGYTRFDFDKYVMKEGVRVRQGSGIKNYWGVNDLGIKLVWELF